MSYIPTLLVNLVESHANYGKIEATFENNNLSSGTENIYYKITSPSGIVIKAINHGARDGELTVGTPIATMPLVTVPIVTNGDFEEGLYSVVFEVENGATLGTYVEYSLSFQLEVLNQGDDNCVKKGLIEYITDCLCLKMTVTDNTDYSDVTLVSREMTIVPPTIPNLPPPTNLVTPNASVTFDFEYSGVTYNTTLFSIYEHYYTPTEGSYPDVVIRESLSYAQSEKVSCAYDLCKLITCINEFFTACIKSASDLGGIQRLPAEKLDKWLLIHCYLTMYNNAVKCKDTATMDAVFKKLQAITGCDCGCGGASSNQIVKLVPLCAGGTGIDTMNGSSPIVVSVVGSTATISLDPTFAALVTNGLQELVVNLLNNSADYLSILAGATATQKKISFNDTPFKYGAWDVAENADVNVAAFGIDVDTTPQPIRWAKSTFHQTVKVDGTFKLNNNIIGVPVCIYLAAIIPAATGTRSGPPSACFDSTGNCVGSIALGGFGANRNVLFTANNNYVIGSVVFCNAIFNLD